WQGDPTRAWHTLPAAEALELLASPPGGLAREEAARRLEAVGPNEVPGAPPRAWWQILLHQFRDPLIYILLLAAAVTLALQDYTDTGVILAVLLLNAVIGYVQEARAQQEMLALARLAAPRAEVERQGAVRSIAGRDVVPGDRVLLTSGTRVPADLRLVSVTGLEVDESALTGESAPVRKGTGPLEQELLVPGDQVNMAFAGTSVTRGRAQGVVVRTGTDTEVGRIAESVHELGEVASPLERSLAAFGRRIGYVVAGLALVVALVGLVRGMDASEIFLAAVALAVSAIPEGLPVVLTVTLAIGVRRMARRGAIVRALPAVETLGSTTVIGSDKTGTLTRNEMTVRAVWAGGDLFRVGGTGYDRRGELALDGAEVEPSEHPALLRTLVAGVLANEAPPLPGDETEELTGDPTEIALLVVAGKAGLPPEGLSAEYPRLDLLPFEPERRLMASLHDGPEGRVVFVKGAPEAILGLCDRHLDPEGREAAPDAEAARRAAAGLAAEGLRVLAMAYRATDQESLADDAAVGSSFVLAGLQGMEDPVRPEAVEAVEASRRAGIRVLMLTGDHVDTARAVGARLGLQPADAPAIDGERLAVLDDRELDGVLERVAVYARVAPEHKLRIVERLKAGGQTVAVTGDGVNDAPALRAAHLGVAMGRGGTDVAREASDIVLADDNFATIAAAVEEGRIVFSNIRKVTFFLLSTAVGEVITILAALFAAWPLPFLAAQILWVNLVTNGVQDVALAFERGEPGLLDRPPRPRREGLVTRRLLERLGAVGLVLAAGTLGIFWWILESSGDLDLARTAALTQMVVFQFFHVFNCRSLDRSILSIPLFGNRLLFASIVAALAAHLAVLHLAPLQAVFRTQPLSLETWGWIVGIGATVILGGELDKAWNRLRRRPLG
ncbi:MAG: cation-translocating P-type ATPase, partial [Thermoanaerobaculia bacterium]